MNDLGNLLKQLRGKRSLREASEISGLSYSYISSLEKGTHPKTKAPIQASPESLKALAKAYNYPYEQLMKVAGYLDKEKPDQTVEHQDYIDSVIKEFSDHYNIDLSDEQKKKILKEGIENYIKALYGERK